MKKLCQSFSFYMVPSLTFVGGLIVTQVKISRCGPYLMDLVCDFVILLYIGVNCTLKFSGFESSILASIFALGHSNW